MFRIREQSYTFLTLVVNILCILFSFAKLKMLMVKLLPIQRESPNHRTSFSLTEGGIDFAGILALTALTIYLHRKNITSMSSV